MLNFEQLKTLIIEPALRDIVMFSDEAVQLLLFTCAVESVGGTYLHQIHGPALGIYQMESKTYNDIWTNYINSKQSLKLQLLHNFNAPVMPDEYRLIYDLRFATAMARIHYYRIDEPLPKLNSLVGLWNYYKAHYNTSTGKASYSGAIEAWNNFRL